MMKNPNPKTSKTKTISCGGAEIVGSNLLVQIFVHLPLKPLFRFKSVSKHWNSIISNPRFQLLMRNQVHNNNRAIGLIYQKFDGRNILPHVETRVVSFDDRSSSSNPLPPQIMVLPDQTLGILHSCNGLMVLKNTDVFAKPKQYYVYNPTTKQITTPLLKDDVIKSRERDKVAGMYLAFDPTKSPHYKVLCVWKMSWMSWMDEQYQFEVYSSETGSWEIRGVHFFTCHVDFDNGVYWNGAIHWFNQLGKKSSYFNPDHEHDEMPREMPAPPIPPFDLPRFYFGESCDHLHCVVSGGDYFSRGINVYEMRRDYSEWFLKFKVNDYSQCLGNSYTIDNLYSVVRGKKDEDSLVIFGIDEGEIISYNLVHNTFQTIHEKTFDFYVYQTNFFQYIESLCSV